MGSGERLACPGRLAIVSLGLSQRISECLEQRQAAKHRSRADCLEQRTLQAFRLFGGSKRRGQEDGNRSPVATRCGGCQHYGPVLGSCAGSLLGLGGADLILADCGASIGFRLKCQRRAIDSDVAKDVLSSSREALSFGTRL